MAAGMNLMDSLGKAAKPADNPNAAAGDGAVVDVVSGEQAPAADSGAAPAPRAEEVRARRLGPGLHK